MAVPGYILQSLKPENYFLYWYEYIIDGKVYRFELHS